jgi:LDH2 family malate/lactate/ureidoglycolate dehydrogenase
MNTNDDSSVLADPDGLRTWAADVLVELGMSQEDAEIAAEVMVTNDVRGTRTHGIRFLPDYVRQLQNGAMNPKAEPRIVKEGPSTAVMDGDGGIGHVVAYRAMQHAIEKTRDSGTGVTVMLVRNSNHFGGAGYFSYMAAAAGQIAIVLTNSVPVMAAPGSRGAVVSNSPFSYGVPTSDGYGDVMLDVALSKVAGAKVVMAAERGESIPEGWIVDENGEPSTNPSDFLGRGALMPIGDHKGYAIAMLVEILSGVLSGAGITHEVTNHVLDYKTPTNTGHTIITLDVDAFMPAAEFQERMTRLRKEIHDTPTAEGAPPLVLPGEPEHVYERETKAHGLRLDRVVYDGLMDVARELGTTESLAAACDSKEA